MKDLIRMMKENPEKVETYIFFLLGSGALKNITTIKLPKVSDLLLESLNENNIDVILR